MKLPTRPPTDAEPRRTGPIYVHLGMTKGAFVATILLAAAVVVGFVVVTRHQHRLDDQQRALRVQQHRLDQQQAELADLAREGREAHQGICVYRADLAARIAATVDYLRTHPEGIAGISRATILNSIRNQKATVASLSAVRGCKP